MWGREVVRTVECVLLCVYVCNLGSSCCIKAWEDLCQTTADKSSEESRAAMLRGSARVKIVLSNGWDKIRAFQEQDPCKNHTKRYTKQVKYAHALCYDQSAWNLQATRQVSNAILCSAWKMWGFLSPLFLRLSSLITLCRTPHTILGRGGEKNKKWVRATYFFPTVHGGGGWRCYRQLDWSRAWWGGRALSPNAATQNWVTAEATSCKRLVIPGRKAANEP